MKLAFYGAVEEVTGSSFLLDTTQGKILVDCGMHQGERMCSTKNLEPFNFEAAHISAVVVTHAHFDHTGRLPLLVKQGFTGKIYMTPPTKALTQIILEDSVNVMRENAEKCGDPVPYGADEVVTMLSHVETVGYHEQFEVSPGVVAMFHDAGHILGSSYVSFDVPGDEFADHEPKRIVFSGDVGNDDVPILPETDPLQKADIVICESTYGTTDHEPTSVRAEKLAAFVKKIIGQQGTLVIPAFSVERTQELLYELDRLLDEHKIADVPIYLDSPLAIRATQLYRDFKTYLRFDSSVLNSADRDFFSFPSLRETLHAEESKKINDDRRPKIIIAGNGMMTGGRVLHHLKRYLSDARSGLLIIGFQAPYTMGRKIQEGAKEVTIYGERVTVRATVGSIEAFSAHADRQKLARWLVPVEGKTPHVYLVHGENHVKDAFATYLKEKINTDVTIPRLNQVFDL